MTRWQFFSLRCARPPFWESKHRADRGAHLQAPGGLTMVHTCVVAGCRNRRTPGTSLSFYRFPRDPERKQRWIAAVNRAGWVPNDGSRLCSTHFISGGDAVQQARASFNAQVQVAEIKVIKCTFSRCGCERGLINAIGTGAFRLFTFASVGVEASENPFDS